VVRLGRRTWRWAFLSVAITLVAAACGGGDDARSGAQAPSATTAGQPTSLTIKLGESGTRDVTATVSGRTLVGRCVGRRTKEPTVVLEVGGGAPREGLGLIENHFGSLTMVCAYDRAGKGQSTPASRLRPITEAVSDLHAFLTAVGDQRYFVVGQSLGAAIAFMYAQAHPDKVVGFVAINPDPPYRTWLKKAQSLHDDLGLAAEEPFYRGEGDNPEGIDNRANESMLTDPLPADMPYVVMFADECGGNVTFCRRMRPANAEISRQLAEVGQGGRFIWVKDGGHDLQFTNPDLVLKHIEQTWKEANRR
jgi:pimeloyl-ACP methyl ester carboxylesterase